MFDSYNLLDFDLNIDNWYKILIILCEKSKIDKRFGNLISRFLLICLLAIARQQITKITNFKPFSFGNNYLELCQSRAVLFYSSGNILIYR